MDCPKCGSGNYVKAGKALGRQRYKCKKCGRHYTVKQRSGRISAARKRLALQLYLEGLGFRSIERIMGVSHVSVINWVKSAGEKLSPLVYQVKPAVIGIDYY